MTIAHILSLFRSETKERQPYPPQRSADLTIKQRRSLDEIRNDRRRRAAGLQEIRRAADKQRRG